MPLILHHLDARTRHFMVTEIQRDVTNLRIYFSDRLNDVGRDEYLRMLLEAAGAYDDDWLANQLQRGGCFNSHEIKRKNGNITRALIPRTAPWVLAEGEFNRFYLRGLCLRAIEDGIPALLVYRAKQVSSPRWESEQLIGTTIPADRLLADLREHIAIETAFGVPAGVGSGLSAKLP
jgi:hypothetical protein